MSNSEAKSLSIIAHLAALFSSLVISVLGPIIIMAAADNSVARDNAAQSLNFQINIIIWAFVSALLCFVLIGFVLLPIVVLWSIINPIVAMVRCAGDENLVYRYPLCIRFLG
jgi:uncharacterized protein